MKTTFYKPIKLTTKGSINLTPFTFLNTLGLTKKKFFEMFNITFMPKMIEVADMGDVYECLLDYGCGNTNIIELDKHDFEITW